MRWVETSLCPTFQYSSLIVLKRLEQEICIEYCSTVNVTQIEITKKQDFILRTFLFSSITHSIDCLPIILLQQLHCLGQCSCPTVCYSRHMMQIGVTQILNRNDVDETRSSTHTCGLLTMIHELHNTPKGGFRLPLLTPWLQANDWHFLTFLSVGAGFVNVGVQLKLKQA